MSFSQALAGRINSSLDELTVVVGRIKIYLEKALTSNDQAYWDAVALNLHGIYSGIERIFEDIARSIDESVPTGPDWHRDILLQMTSEVKGIRPLVITRKTRICLDEFRGFRHVVRNVYTFNLRPSRIEELAKSLPVCFQMVKEDLSNFIKFVDSLE